MFSHTWVGFQTHQEDEVDGDVKALPGCRREPEKSVLEAVLDDVLVVRND